MLSLITEYPGEQQDGRRVLALSQAVGHLVAQQLRIVFETCVAQAASATAVHWVVQW